MDAKDSQKIGVFKRQKKSVDVIARNLEKCAVSDPLNAGQNFENMADKVVELSKVSTPRDQQSRMLCNGDEISSIMSQKVKFNCKESNDDNSCYLKYLNNESAKTTPGLDKR